MKKIPRGVAVLTPEHKFRPAARRRKGTFFSPVFGFVPASRGLRTFWQRLRSSAASAPVNEATSYGQVQITPETALTISAVWACVWRYANTIATIPLQVMQTGAQNTAELRPNHPLYTILHDRPNANMSASSFWKGMLASMLSWSFCIAEKIRIGNRVVALDPWRPEYTTTYLDGDGMLRYRYWANSQTDPNGGRDVAADDVFVVLDRTMDGLTGLSRIQYGANSMGLALAADRASALSWKNGLRASGILTIAQWLKPEQREAYRTLVNEFTGTGEGLTTDKQFGVLVAENATKFEPISLKPQDMELLASRQFSVEDVCRWYDIPPILIGHSAEGQTMWGSGIEQIILGWQKLSLAPILRTIEQEIWRQLLSNEDRTAGYFAEFNLDSLLRGDSAARAAFYSAMATNGVYTRNEIRARENLPPKEGGDVLTVQSALVPLEKLGTLPATAAPPGDPAAEKEPKTEEASEREA